MQKPIRTFPGSSEQTALPPLSQAEPLPTEVLDKLAALASDEPLPTAYDRDRIRLLLQSPRRLYLYWNFRDNPFERLPRAFGNRAAEFHFGVRLLDLSRGVANVFLAWADETARAGQFWFDAHPATRYSAQVGFFTNQNLFVRLLASDSVRTPRMSVSPRADETPEFMSPPTEFGRVLEEAGYVRDALAVRLEVADATPNADTTRSLVARLLRADASELNSIAKETLRAILLAIILGESFDSLDLPADLRARLRSELAARDFAELRSELSAALGIDSEELDFIELHDALTQTSSSDRLGGSSRVNSTRRRSWLPSLDHEMLHSIKRR